MKVISVQNLPYRKKLNKFQCLNINVNETFRERISPICKKKKEFRTFFDKNLKEMKKNRKIQIKVRIKQNKKKVQ